MAYTGIPWENSPSTRSPINATNLEIMDNGIAEADANATSAKTEVEDVRIGADGKTYQSAGAAVRGQFNDVKDILRPVEMSLLDGVKWQVGSISSSGTESGATNTIRTGFIDLSGIKTLTVTIDTNYKWGWHFYNANYEPVANASTWVTQATTSYVILSNYKYLRINLTPVVSAPADLNWAQYISAIYQGYGIVNDIDRLNDTVKMFDYSEESITENIVWEMGTIKNDGTNENSTFTIRTPFIEAPETDYLNINAYLHVKMDSQYKYGWHFYDASKIQIAGASSYIHIPDSYTPIPKNTKYIRLNMAKYNNAQASTDWGALYISAKCEYPVLQAVDLGDGDNFYTGEKIRLSEDDRVHYCDIELWKEFTSENTENISSYNLSKNQSIALFGGYLFELNDGGTISIIDYSTKNIVDYVELELTELNHQNSAQFSDIYYDVADEFPLLFVSRCGNSTAGTQADTCLVYRIVRTNSDFEFTLINTIKADFVTHGNSWCVDNVNKKIHMVGYVNGTWVVTDNNPIMFFAWNMPSKEEILSGNMIILERENCISTCEIDYAMLQSACAYCGLVFIGISSSFVQSVYCIDSTKGKIRNRIPLISTNEVEGISIYNDKMYISHKKNTDPQLQIYEISF